MGARQLVSRSLCCVGLWLAGCGDGTRDPGSGLREPMHVDATVPPVPDADGDGLCDDSELDLGSDPGVADTDGDGLWDVVELSHGYDPAFAGEPDDDQVGLLEARRGATLSMQVRTTVDGRGQGLSGVFEPISEVGWGGEGDVVDFYAGATAVSADPTDNVRGADLEAERFEIVQGPTRLGFEVHFEYPFATGIDCASSYPFRYKIKTDAGETVAQRDYLLVVAPEGSVGGEVRFCVPEPCL